MSRRRKLEKFADILNYDHVYEYSEIGKSILKANKYDHIDLRGRWRSEVFGNDNPLCVELACGRGEYTLGLAERYPDKNFIGVDIKGARIWQGATKSKERGMSNVAFLRIRIEQIELYFEKGEIDEIWITFPDPFPAKENRRTTCDAFLHRYHQIVKSGGKLNLKTDDDDFFKYSVDTVAKNKNYEIIYKNNNIYGQELYNQDLDIKTYYELEHLSKGKTIKYLLFTKIG